MQYQIRVFHKGNPPFPTLGHHNLFKKRFNANINLPLRPITFPQKRKVPSKTYRLLTLHIRQVYGSDIPS